MGSKHLSVLPIFEPYSRSAKEEPFYKNNWQAQVHHTPKSSSWKSVRGGSQKLLYSCNPNNHKYHVYPPYFPFSINLLQKWFEPLIHILWNLLRIFSRNNNLKPSIARNHPPTLPLFLLLVLHSGLEHLLTEKRAHRTGNGTCILHA